jgi:hypothetical protein
MPNPNSTRDSGESLKLQESRTFDRDSQVAEVAEVAEVVQKREAAAREISCEARESSCFVRYVGVYLFSDATRRRVMA